MSVENENTKKLYKSIKQMLCSHRWEYEMDLTNSEFKRVCRYCDKEWTL